MPCPSDGVSRVSDDSFDPRMSPRSCIEPMVIAGFSPRDKKPGSLKHPVAARGHVFSNLSLKAVFYIGKTSLVSAKWGDYIDLLIG